MAEPTWISPYYDGTPMETPLGSMTTSTVRGLCWSPEIRIGKVVSSSVEKKAFYFTDGATFFRPVTTIEFSTLRTIKGQSTSTFSLNVVGGKVGDLSTTYQKAYPYPIEGLVYVLGFQFLKTLPPHSAWSVGQPWINAVLKVNDIRSLPSEALLASEIEAFCSSAF